MSANPKFLAATAHVDDAAVQPLPNSRKVYVGELRVPTHIIWGADDGVVPVAYAEELRRGIPGAQLHVLEGAAHIPHLQQPQRFLECLTAIS